MALIYVPERKIRANFKPDFPVENTGKGLVSSWVFQESAGNASDLRGLNNATAIASPIRTITKEGRAEVLNGTTQYYDAGNSSSVKILGAITLIARISVSAWPPNSPDEPGFQTIIGKGYDGTNEGYYLRIHNVAGVLKLQAGSYNGTDYSASWDISGWGLNDFHTVAGLYDGTNWALYFDGKQVASAVQTTGAISCTANLYLGAEYISTAPSRFFNGNISWIDFYNRGLGSAELKAYQPLRPKQRDLYVAYSSSSSITANANITQASNTPSSDASLLISADASISQSGNTLTADATEIIQANASLAQAANTLTSDASLVSNTITANASITQADNALTSAAALLVAADASVTQAANTLASTATTTEIKADANITQAGDSLYSVGQLQSTSQVYGDGGRHSSKHNLSREDVEAAWELLELRRKNALADKVISKPRVKEVQKQKPKQEPARPAVVLDQRPLLAVNLGVPHALELVSKLKPLVIGRPMDMAVATAYSKRISAVKESTERAISAARQADDDAAESAAQQTAQSELKRIIAMRRRDEEELLMLLLLEI